MSLDLAGKTALVTGASKGVGKGIALALGRAGCDVIVNYNSDRQGAEEVAAELRGIGRQAAIAQGNVGQSADVAAMFAEADKLFPALDILVNNAGVQTWKPLLELEEFEWDRVIDTNLKGLFLAAKSAVPAMRQRGGGAIVAISSVQAYASQTSVAAYTASKGGVNALVRAMALDHAPDNITVNTVCPGSVDTPMLRGAADLFTGAGTAEETLAAWGRSHPVGRVGQPSEVAEAVAFLASDKARFITGADLKVDGGLMSKIGVVLPD